MGRGKNHRSILTEGIDDELLSRMPLWFRRLREVYTKRTEG